MKRVLLIIVVGLVGVAIGIGIGLRIARCRAERAGISLDQVPAAVRQTLIAEARSGALDQIRKEFHHKQAVYEAQATIDGERWELKVTEGGKLIKKELREEDERDHRSPPAAATHPPER